MSTVRVIIQTTEGEEIHDLFVFSGDDDQEVMGYALLEVLEAHFEVEAVS